MQDKQDNANQQMLPGIQDEGDEINLVDYLRVIYNHRRMIVGVCVIAVAATLLISLVMPNIFAATASVVPPIDIIQQQSKASAATGLAKNSMIADVLGVTSIADMYAGILKSRIVVDAIIDQFKLQQVYGEQYMSDVRKKLRRNTKVKVSDEGIVTITVEDRDPVRAAAMANAYVEQLDKQNKRLSSGQATSKRVFLENRLQELERELSQIDTLPSNQARIKEMLFEMLTREYELAKIEEAKSMPTIQILDKAVVPEKKVKPKRAVMAVLAGVTALFFGTFAAFVRECLAKAKTRPAASACA